MSLRGRPEGEHRSAQHEGSPWISRGRPEGELRSAQHEGSPLTPHGRPEREHRSAHQEDSSITAHTAIKPNDRDWKALVRAAAEPYRAAGLFSHGFARGKLGVDPVFRHIIGHGLIAPRARVLDIGCGQGLLAGLLRAAAAQASRGEWPRSWAAAPEGTRITGIELMAKDVARARAALGATAQAEFIHGDMRRTPFRKADVVVILDVLHYIDIAEQDAVLDRVRSALPAGGRLLLRIGDDSPNARFHASQIVDRLVTFIRGHRRVPTFTRPLAAWINRIEALGFTVQAQPMSQGTPFANVLLTAQLPVAAAQPARSRETSK